LSTTSVEPWEVAWQPLVDAVGTDFGEGRDHPGADDIEYGNVRRYLEPLEFDCPLHFDRQVARAHGYDSVLAPYSALSTFTIPPLWTPEGGPIFLSDQRDSPPAGSMLRPTRTGLEPDVGAYFATDIGMEYVRPAVVGDRLRREGYKLLSCSPKETSVGRGAFTKWETRVLNQRDELVALTINGLYQYEPFDAESGRPKKGGATVSSPPRRQPYRPRTPVDWSVQRRWEDVEEGETIESQAFPLTVYRLVVEAGANRDFNAIHHNSEYAKSTGAPEMYANNIFLQGMWERTVRDYIGLDGRIRALSGFRMRIFNTVGDTCWVHGHVKRKWLEGADGLVALELHSTNSIGVSVGPGIVTVSLPRS
jgi:acyl dehydratase